MPGTNESMTTQTIRLAFPILGQKAKEKIKTVINTVNEFTEPHKYYRRWSNQEEEYELEKQFIKKQFNFNTIKTSEQIKESMKLIDFNVSKLRAEINNYKSENLTVPTEDRQIGTIVNTNVPTEDTPIEPIIDKPIGTNYKKIDLL